MKKHHWDLPNQTFVIQNVLNIAPQSISQENSEENSIEFVFFGRIEPRKGTDIFVGAFELLGREFLTTNRVIITFMGSGAAFGQKIKKQWENSENLRNITVNFIHGYSRDEAIRYLQSGLRIAVIPSTIENSPYTVLECIENKIKFIASAVGK